MRATFGSIHRNATAGLETASNRLLEFQRQISSGKRIETPSDDPGATLGSIGEHDETARIDQYARAANSISSRLSVVDTVLSDLITQLQSGLVAATSARGTTKTVEQREAAATDLEAIRDTILSDVTISFNGAYLFSGSASTVAPFVKPAGGPVSAYAGSTQEMDVDIDRNRSVKVAFDGRELAQGSDASDIFAAFDALIAAVRAGDDAGIGQGMDALQRMFDRVSIVQGRVGADLRLLDEQKLRLDVMKRASAARLSKLENANMAEAITSLQQADASYRAALGAVGAVTRISLMDYLR